MSANKDSLAKNTILLAVGNMLTKGLLFVMVPFFSSWLSAEDYGLFDLFCTYVSLLIPFITLATGEAVFRFSVEKDTDENKRNAYISNGLAIVTINCCIVTIVLLIVKFVSGWELAIPFILLLIGELYNNHLQSYLRAIKKLNIYSFCSAFSVVIIAALVTIFVKFLNMGLNGIIIGYAVGYLLGDILVALFTKYYSYIKVSSISKSEMLKLIKYSYPLIPNSVSWWIINVSDRFVIKLMIGAAANGIYAISNKIPALCSAVFGVFNISWQQAATEIVEQGDEQKTINYFNSVYNSVIKRLFAICIGILSLNFVFFRWIFDQKYYSGYVYSPILITAIIFMLVSQFFGGIQISLKMPKENGITTVSGAICNVVLNFATVKYWGLYAAAISTLISYLLVEELRRWKLKKNVRFRLSRENYYNLAIYIYYLISSYFIQKTTWSLINLVCACIIFVVLNRDFVEKIIRKVLRR